MKTIKNNLRNIVIVLLIVIFVALSFKKVYTSDTLIPNLEPYPDSLYYSVPAWNFVHGKGFEMETQSVVIKQETPPLYGIYLIPFFAIFNDVRSFYFANMIVMIATIILFGFIIDKLFSGKAIYKAALTFFLGFFLASNFYFYSIPQLLMAEPITIFLVTLGIYLYFSKSSNAVVAAASQLPFLLILVKVSNIPYAFALVLIFAYKFYSEKKFKSFLIGLGIGTVYLVTYFLSSRLLIGHKNLGGTDFSPIHFQKGIEFYFRALTGRVGVRYLWFSEKFLPQIVAALSLLGILVGLANSKTRKNALALLVPVVSAVLFMSFFVTQDIRYIIAALPVNLLLIGYLFDKIGKKTNTPVVIALMLLVLTSTLFLKNQGYKESEMALLTFKKQVGLNLRHREVPWNYEAVRAFNQLTMDSEPQKTYIATFLPPPYIELFSNHKYQTLPISSWQAFYWVAPHLLDKGISKDVAARYKQLINKGSDVYITRYYQSNVPSQWPKQFDEITRNFLLEKVQEGCLGACDIYKLKIVE